MRSHSDIAQRRWALIADDLTGACDAAAAFAQAGFAASFGLDHARFQECTADLLAYSTETRNADEADATVLTGLACDRLLDTGRLILFKKIDSVLRGSPLAEVEVVRRKLGGIPAVLTPALPAQGRVVREGTLLVIDPETGGQLDPPRKIPAAEKVRIADAESFADLRQVAAESLGEPATPLFAGSAGLAKAVAAELAARYLPQANPTPLQPSLLPALFLVGTDHAVTAAQIAALKTSIPGIEVPLDTFALKPVLVSALVRLSWDPPAQLDAVAARLRAGEIGTLILSGGDTARYVLDAFGAREIVLGGELEPGISWGRIRGGSAGGLTVVTKSGGFGRKDLLLRILQAVATANVRH